MSEGYPDSSDGRYSCIATVEPYTYTLEWINDNCEIRRPFLCEVPASANPTTIQPPTLTPDMPCHSETPNDGWIQFTKDQGGTGEACYNFNLGDYKSWLDASDECVRKGGRLTSVRSDQENRFLLQHLNTFNDVVSWIGLQRDGLTGQFVWIEDWTSPDYLAWGPGGKKTYQLRITFVIKSYYSTRNDYDDMLE